MDLFEIRSWFAHNLCDYLREGDRKTLDKLEAVLSIAEDGSFPISSGAKFLPQEFPLIVEDSGYLRLSEEIDSFTEEYVRSKAESYRRFLSSLEGFIPIGDDVEKTVSMAKKLFESKLFFEVHELLEELWMGEFGELRDFLQALIQIGVAFYHRENFNERGYRLLLENALELLNSYSGMVHGINVDKLKEELLKAKENSDYPHTSLLTE